MFVKIDHILHLKWWVSNFMENIYLKLKLKK